MKQVTVVGAVIQDNRKRVLCGLRPPHMILGGYWEFPGGKVEVGEDFSTALIREIDEELSCEIEVKAKITEVTHDYENIRVNLHTYWCKIKSGTPIANEHARLEWLTIDELTDLNWAPADIPTITILQKQ